MGKCLRFRAKLDTCSFSIHVRMFRFDLYVSELPFYLYVYVCIKVKLTFV